jgi:hypothetical protein
MNRLLSSEDETSRGISLREAAGFLESASLRSE